MSTRPAKRPNLNDTVDHFDLIDPNLPDVSFDESEVGNHPEDEEMNTVVNNAAASAPTPGLGSGGTPNMYQPPAIDLNEKKDPCRQWTEQEKKDYAHKKCQMREYCKKAAPYRPRRKYYAKKKYTPKKKCACKVSTKKRKRNTACSAYLKRAWGFYNNGLDPYSIIPPDGCRTFRKPGMSAKEADSIFSTKSAPYAKPVKRVPRGTEV